MTGKNGREFDASLDSYLDGALDPAARLQFEERLGREPDLRRMLDEQRAIDVTLRRAFEPPTADRILGAALAGAARSHRTKPIRPWWISAGRYAAAAIIILCVSGGAAWLLLDQLDSGPAPFKPRPLREMAQVYTDEVRTGFKPNWICAEDRVFAMTFWHRFGQGLLLAEPASESVAMVGLSYSGSLSPYTVHMLACVDDAPVVVFVDELKKDVPRPETADGGRLHLFRRVIGDLVLYEVTPLAEPRFLDLFYIPQIPNDWMRGSAYLSPPPS